MKRKKQSEFNFVRKMRRNGFFGDHFFYDVGWDEDNEEDRLHSVSSLWNSVIRHIRIGF